MSLPWNRGGPEDSSDSLLDRLPLVPGSSGEDSASGAERSVPRRVATAGGSSGDGRDSPRGRSDGDPLGDVAPAASQPAGGESTSPGGESTDPAEREAADGELSVRQ